MDLLKKAFQLFMKSNAIKLSAALSYYTVFSICPFLIVIISVVGLVYGREAVEGKIYHQISGLAGSSAAAQIQQIIVNIQHTHHTVIGGIIAFVILIVGASSVFSEIQDSINGMWNVRPRSTHKGWVRILINRLLSFSILAGIAFILMVSLTVNSLIDVLSEKLKAFLPDYLVNVFYFVNIAFIFVIITLLFSIIFKILPNAVLRWKEAFIGAAFTALLFLLGKLLIGFYLGNSKIGATYGAAASIVIIMLWVYYSSMILYFGAAFTRYLIADDTHTQGLRSKRAVQQNNGYNAPPAI